MVKKHKCLLLPAAFLLPVMLFSALLAFEHFAPFGEKSLLIMDMSDQYVEFFNGLRSGDVFFSWSKSLGTNYIGLFAYYVSSPFSVLTLFFSGETMHYGILLLTLLKLGCVGLTSCIYFKRQWGVKGFASLIFSVSCSMMSYCMAYSMCVMWLDGVIWLPVILLGIENILAGDDPRLFRIGFLVCLLSTYYITYMIVIFSVLYFLVRACEDKTEAFWKKLFCFAGNGVITAGLAAFFVIPVLLSSFEGRVFNTLLGYSGTIIFPARDLAEKLLFGGYDSITNSGTPYIYCGAAILWFAIVFLAGERIPLRSKLCWSGLAVILLMSFWLSPLDIVWHAFQHPNWFPARYAFLFSFVLICMAARAFSAAEVSRRRAAVVLLLVFVSADLFWNGDRILRGLDDQFGYVKAEKYSVFHREKAELLDAVDESDAFFRIRSSVDRSKNDAIGFDYNGLTHYSSSYLGSLNSWAHEAGLGQGWIWCSDYGSTPVTDLFLDIRYAVSEDLPGPFYRRVFENDLGSLYETSVSGSLGYFAKTGIPAEAMETEDPFAYQNALFSMMTGVSDVFTPQACDLFIDDGETLIETVSTGSPLFVYFPSGNGNAALYVNDAYRSGLFTGETDCIHYVGEFPAGETVQIRVTDMIDSCILRQLDTNRFTDGLTELCGFSLSDVKNNGSVTGTVTCAADGEILTSIPDGGGWRVWVDGRRVQTVRALGTFISIPVSQGDHTVTMKYSPPGTAAGAVVSFAALITLIAVKVVKKKKVY